MAASATSPKVGLRRRSTKNPLQDKVLNSSSPKKSPPRKTRDRKGQNRVEAEAKTTPGKRRSHRSGSGCEVVLDPDDQDENAETASLGESPASSASTTPKSKASANKRKLDLNESDDLLYAKPKEAKATKSASGERKTISSTKYVANSSGKIIVGTKGEAEGGEEKETNKARRTSRRDAAEAEDAEERTNRVFQRVEKEKASDFIISFDIKDLSASILTPEKKRRAPSRGDSNEFLRPSGDRLFACRDKACAFSESDERRLLDHVAEVHVKQPSVVLCRRRVDYRNSEAPNWRKCRECERLLSSLSRGVERHSHSHNAAFIHSPRKTKKSILNAIAFDLKDDFDSDDEGGFGGNSSSLVANFVDVEACVEKVRLTEEEQRQVEEREEKARKERVRKEKERERKEKERERKEERMRKEKEEMERREKEWLRKAEEEDRAKEREKLGKLLKELVPPNKRKNDRTVRANVRDQVMDLTANNAQLLKFQPFVRLDRREGILNQPSKSMADTAKKAKESAKDAKNKNRRTSRRS